jgi:hypothetical protein
MLNAAVQQLPGLLRIELVRLGPNEWMDVVLWEDQQSAERALGIAGTVPEFAAWFAHISEDVSMEHGEIVDRGEPAAGAEEAKAMAL